jgi:ankyrin repeat protein
MFTSESIFVEVVFQESHSHSNDGNVVLMQGAPLNEADHCGDPPLLLAAGNGEIHVSMLSACMITMMADQPTRHEINGFEFSITGHTACCNLLLEEGADIEQRNVMGEAPLIRAAHNGHLKTVKFLVEKGADVNAVDMGDNSALHWAAMRGHVEIVKYLLEQGADKTIRNKQEKLPIDLCQPNWSDSFRFTREILA